MIFDNFETSKKTLATALTLSKSWRDIQAGMRKPMSDVMREKLLFALLYLEAGRSVQRPAIRDRLFGTWVRMQNRRLKAEVEKFAKHSKKKAA